MNEYQLIQDITYEYNADIGLSYSSPCRGVWNIVHIGTLVPSAHQIYVCPTSCLRGVVLTTAEMGAMHRLSTITVGEDNILEGDMEETLLNGTRKIIESLPQRPRMIMIFISCIHHFLAANYQRVYKILRKEYPDIEFVDAYMDPIMRRKTPPIPSLMRQIYRVMDKCEPVLNQVNYIDQWFSAPEHNDLTMHLKQQGIVIHDLSEETSYDSFKEMEKSAVNFTFHPYGNWAGKDMKLRIQKPWIKMRPSFNYDVIDEDIKKASLFLGIANKSEEEISTLREQTEKKVNEALAVLKDTEISVDYTAVDEPISLTVYLLKHHFNVTSLFIENITESEEIFEELKALKPDLKIYSAENWNMRRIDREVGYKVVGIGQKAAYFHNSPYFINMIYQGGGYGYRGMMNLMDLLIDACLNPRDMRKEIQIKGWGCHNK